MSIQLVVVWIHSILLISSLFEQKNKKGVIERGVAKKLTVPKGAIG
jgi:hypothetical protein